MDTGMVFIIIILVMMFFIICAMYNKICKIGIVVGTNYINIQQLCTQMNKVEEKIDTGGEN